MILPFMALRITLVTIYMVHYFVDSNRPYARGFVKGNELAHQECMRADRVNKCGAKSSGN